MDQCCFDRIRGWWELRIMNETSPAGVMRWVVCSIIFTLSFSSFPFPILSISFILKRPSIFFSLLPPPCYYVYEHPSYTHSILVDGRYPGNSGILLHAACLSLFKFSLTSSFYYPIMFLYNHFSSFVIELSRLPNLF